MKKFKGLQLTKKQYEDIIYLYSPKDIYPRRYMATVKYLYELFISYNNRKTTWDRTPLLSLKETKDYVDNYFNHKNNTMTEIKLEIGLLYTYRLGLIPETVYKYIEEEPHGMALLETKTGSRWHFSRNALVPATEEQIKEFNKECPDCKSDTLH
jgi:hypothetical protein